MLQLVQGNQKCLLQLFWFILVTKILTNNTSSWLGQVAMWAFSTSARTKQKHNLEKSISI
jgi:hypothetical protein